MTKPGAVARPPDLPRLNAAWARLRKDEGLKGRHWSKAAVDVTDNWLRELFDWAVAWAGDDGAGAGRRRTRRPAGGAGEAAGPERSDGDNPATGVALLAVGSLGRGDLAPGSDLDPVAGALRSRRDVAEIAERIWYPVWDDPMPLDHSVRTLAQVGQAAESDLRVALGLLDARPVAGGRLELAAGAGRRWAGGLWAKRVGQVVASGGDGRRGQALATGPRRMSPSCWSPSSRRAGAGCGDLQRRCRPHGHRCTPVVAAVAVARLSEPGGKPPATSCMR